MKNDKTNAAKLDVKVNKPDGNAILLTGATHARELLSMQVPLFECLKLIRQGVLQNKEKYQ